MLRIRIKRARREPGAEKRVRNLKELKEVFDVRADYDAEHPGETADTMRPTHISHDGAMLVQIRHHDTRRRRLLCNIVFRNETLEQLGCDGCGKRHNPKMPHCSASKRELALRTGREWDDDAQGFLKQMQRTLEDEENLQVGEYVFYTLREPRRRYGGPRAVWSRRQVTADEERHVSGRMEFVQVSDGGGGGGGGGGEEEEDDGEGEWRQEGDV